LATSRSQAEEYARRLKQIEDPANYHKAAEVLSRPTVTSNPVLVDTDWDGPSDFEEYQKGSDPDSRDSDGDGISDAREQGLRRRLRGHGQAR